MPGCTELQRMLKPFWRIPRRRLGEQPHSALGRAVGRQADRVAGDGRRREDDVDEEPPPDARISGIRCLVPRNTPSTLIACCRHQSSRLHVGDGAADRDAGVVHQHVQAAYVSEHEGDQPRSSPSRRLRRTACRRLAAGLPDGVAERATRSIVDVGDINRSRLPAPGLAAGPPMPDAPPDTSAIFPDT